MKDFQEFKKTITTEMLDKWNTEICSKLDANLEYIRESEPTKYRLSYDRSYSLKMTTKLLEAYHFWLNQ